MYMVPIPATFVWSSSADPMVRSPRAVKRRTDSARPSAGKESAMMSGPRWPIKVPSALVGTRSSSPSHAPMAVHSRLASTARTRTPPAFGQFSGPAGAIDHCPSMRRCDRNVNGSRPSSTNLARICFPVGDHLRDGPPGQVHVPERRPPQFRSHQRATGQCRVQSSSGPQDRIALRHDDRRPNEGASLAGSWRIRWPAALPPPGRSWRAASVPSIRVTVNEPIAPPVTFSANARPASCRSPGTSVNEINVRPPRSA